MKALKLSLPFIIFVLIVALLWRGLGLHPAQVPSPLINKSAPAFELPTLFDAKKITTQHDFIGKVTLVNVWATWCEACAEEHGGLMYLARNEQVNLYGIDYKDDVIAARKWLKQNGNPYQIVAVDTSGKTAIDWGVYGTPETFVIDKKGRIRYKHIGAIDRIAWEKTLQPLLTQLRSEPE